MAYTSDRFRARVRVDRGTRRGAKRMIVTPDFELIDHALAKTAGIDGIYFQSKAEAMRWIALNVYMLRAGVIRNLRRQVPYPLHVVNPDGLKVKIGKWTADFVYEERRATHPADTGEMWEWVEVIEDVKGNPEDAYLWKKKHFEAEYGKGITESKAWARR